MALQAENYIPALKYGATVNTANDIALASGHLIVGNSSGLGTDVALSGDATLADTGAITIADKAVSTNKTNFITGPKATIAAKSATADLAAGDYGKNITNTGAVGAIELTLLAAATAGVSTLRVYVTVAQTVTLVPQTGEKIYLAGSGVASKKLVVAGVIGNFVDLFCDGVDYSVVNYSGVVTKEA